MIKVVAPSAPKDCPPSQTKNVLGKTKTKVTKGNQVTSVSPFLVARDSALGKELYEIDRLNKQLDEVKYQIGRASGRERV